MPDEPADAEAQTPPFKGVPQSSEPLCCGCAQPLPKIYARLRDGKAACKPCVKGKGYDVFQWVDRDLEEGRV